MTVNPSTRSDRIHPPLKKTASPLMKPEQLTAMLRLHAANHERLTVLNGKEAELTETLDRMEQRLTDLEGKAVSLKRNQKQSSTDFKTFKIVAGTLFIGALATGITFACCLSSNRPLIPHH